MRARHWPLVVAVLFLVALSGALGAAAWRAAGGHLVYALDDTYIQMAIAKNLAAHGVWGVTRYEFSGAGSSLLWPWLLAAVDRVAGLDERTPFVLNVLASVALLVLAHAAPRHHVTSGVMRAIALVLLVVTVPLAVLPLVGMEHAVQAVAALALAVAGVRSCTASDAVERRRMFGWTLVAAALTVAVRYDAASVLVVVAVVAAATRGWRSAVAITLAGAAPALVYAAVAHVHGWPFVPSSVLIKQRLAGVSLLTWHGFADVAGGGALTALVYAPSLFVLVLAAVAQLTWRADDSEDPRARERRLLLVVFAGAALVHVQFGRLGWLYRYEASLVALGIVANAASLAGRISIEWPSRRPLQLAAFVALAALTMHPLLVRGVLAARDAVADVDDLYRHEYQLGRFFARYPPTGALLIGDVGMVAYFSDVPIVDASGLATRELIELGHGPYDWDLVQRAARQHGARVSIAGSPIRGAGAWPCVAEWKAREEHRPDVMFFFASDPVAAVALERDLRAFAAEDAEHVTVLTFAAQMQRPCS